MADMPNKNKLSFVELDHATGEIGVCKYNSRTFSETIIRSGNYSAIREDISEYPNVTGYREKIGGIDVDISYMKYPEVITPQGNAIVSDGYIKKSVHHPRDIRIYMFPVIGSGVRGVVTHSRAPDTINIALGNFFYIKGHLGRRFFETLVDRTNSYLVEYVNGNGKLIKRDKLKLLAQGWNTMFRYDFIPTKDEPKMTNYTIKSFKDMVDYWYRHYVLSTRRRDSKYVKMKLPTEEHIIPSFVTFLMVNRGYKSLVYNEGNAIIYPPYVADVLWEALF